MIKFGEKLKELRESRGLTPDELAAEIDFTKSTIWSYELGKKEPSIDHLRRLGHFFNVPVDELLGEKKIFEGNKHIIRLNDEHSRSKYIFELDDQPISDEELNEMIVYLRVKRSMVKQV